MREKRNVASFQAGHGNKTGTTDMLSPDKEIYHNYTSSRKFKLFFFFFYLKETCFLFFFFMLSVTNAI